MDNSQSGPHGAFQDLKAKERTNYGNPSLKPENPTCQNIIWQDIIVIVHDVNMNVS
jgi:hypothetical protein